MQEELRQVETPEILLTLIQQLNYTAWEKEKILQTEENGNKIANLQGFLAGARSYKNTMRNIGYILDEEFDGTENRIPPFFDSDGDCSIKLSRLREVVSTLNEVTASDDYEKFTKLWAGVVDNEKNSLFYYKEKGRDLHFAKGWYEAMDWVNKTIKKLDIELAVAEKKEAESLPFDDGE